MSLQPEKYAKQSALRRRAAEKRIQAQAEAAFSAFGFVPVGVRHSLPDSDKAIAKRVFRHSEKQNPFLTSAEEIPVFRPGKAKLTLAEIERLINDGDLFSRIDAISERAAKDIAQAFGIELNAATLATIDYIQSSTIIRIDQSGLDLRAARLLEQETFSLVREFADENRKVLAEKFADATFRGLNPRDQARQVRHVVGLNSQLAGYADNFRSALGRIPESEAAFGYKLRDKRSDKLLRNAIKAKRQLTNDEIEIMTMRYKARAIKQRAITIARTEALRAVNTANHETFQTLVDSGEVPREKMFKTWRAAGDERTRPTHAALNGVKLQSNEIFGNGLRFPGDPQGPSSETVQCRCVLSYTIGKK